VGAVSPVIVLALTTVMVNWVEAEIVLPCALVGGVIVVVDRQVLVPAQDVALVLPDVPDGGTEPHLVIKAFTSSEPQPDAWS